MRPPAHLRVGPPVLAALVAVALSVMTGRPASAAPLRLVVLGDSLSSGFMIGTQAAMPAVLEASLRRMGYDVSIYNAGVVNDTSWDGLARLDRDVPAGTDGVIVELGANDQLRRVSPAVTRTSLDQIVGRLRGRGVAVMLAGFRMPLSLGQDSQGFAAAYASVAQRHRLIYYPDVYAGLWTDPSMTILDGAHPSAAGVQRMVAGMLPSVVRFIKALPTAGKAKGRPSG